MYARLCQRLCEEAPMVEINNESITFRQLLVTSCRAQFESRSNDKTNKRKSLGNIKFIGELCKLELIAQNILHKCIISLLEKKPEVDELAEDLECLCQIMRTCGQVLDEEKAKSLMDQYFVRMAFYAKSQVLPIRIRFMLRDIIELRKNRWIPRRATNIEGPLPITQMSEDGSGMGMGPLGGAPLQRERAPQQELFPRSLKTRTGAFDGVLSSSLSFAQPPPSSDKFSSMYNSSNGYQGGLRERGPSSRQSHHQQSHFYQQNRYNSQHNNNNSNNVSSTKDLPPRFKRMIAPEQSSANLEEISLRPPAQSMVFKPPNAKPLNSLYSGGKPPGLMGGDSHLTPTSLKPAPPIQTTKEVPILIKQANTERSKPSKKDKATTKEETMKKIASIAEDILGGGNLADSVNSYTQLKVQDRLVPETLHSLLSKTYDKTDADRETMMSFISSLKKEGAITAANFGEAFRILIKSIPDQEATVPSITNYIAEFSARAVKSELLTIAQIGEVTEDGTNFPLLFNSLQELNKSMEKQQLTDLFNESKVSLMGSLPSGERTKERLSSELGERGLTFLEPLLLLEGELWLALEREPTAASLYKCAKESVDPSHHDTPPFVSALLSVTLKYITQESTQGKGVPPIGVAEKILQEKEKALLQRFKNVLQAFLRENVNLQVTAVYALQVFCYSLDFPKGMLLRWFVNLYDLEIIEEEAFLKWREDVTDAYPGKGKALFQVNQWLTWLAEAESEEEEEEGGAN